MPAASWPARQVLVLNSFDLHAMHNAVTAEAFREELERQFGDALSITEMSLDARWNEDAREPVLAELLHERQAYLPLDIVLAEGPPAISFWLKYRDRIAPDAALIAAARKGTFEPADLRPDDVGFWSDFSFATAIDDILAVRPQTDRVLIVLGSTELERELTRQAQAELAGFHGITFEYSNDYSLGELQSHIEVLEPGSAVYLSIFSTDRQGIILKGHGALALAHSSSPVPVFGPFDDQLGLGIVGGRLIPLREQGRWMAEVAGRILRGQPVAERWNRVRLTPPTYDWRELERWAIDRDSLPPDSRVRYEPEPAWRTYAVEISLAVAFIAGQSLLIGGLLTQRRRTRQAERSERHLAGMLISAHEDEHRRIARELHDDLSQRLARLSIDIGLLSRSEQANGLQQPLSTLQAEVAGISEDIHGLSYRLHPSIVDDLGITTALRAECRRIREHDDVRIVDAIDTLDVACPRDVGLCLYRICQEALANAVRHSDAATIEVRLTREGDDIELTITDDGCGFDPAAARSGLGLSSMRERARLLGGTLSLSSTPGAGTTVRARLPVPQAGTREDAVGGQAPELLR
ncbi:MAG: ATP-binding protein [Pseudomonadales bacterium]